MATPFYYWDTISWIALSMVYSGCVLVKAIEEIAANNWTRIELCSMWTTNWAFCYKDTSLLAPHGTTCKQDFIYLPKIICWIFLASLSTAKGEFIFMEIYTENKMHTLYFHQSLLKVDTLILEFKSHHSTLKLSQISAREVQVYRFNNN